MRKAHKIKRCRYRNGTQVTVYRNRFGLLAGVVYVVVDDIKVKRDGFYWVMIQHGDNPPKPAPTEYLEKA